MNGKSFRINNIFTKILFACVVLAEVISIIAIINSNSGAKIKLEDNWNISYNGKEESNTSVEKYKFDMVNKGDKIILSRKIDKVDISQPAILLKVYHSVIYVRLDGEIIYKFGDKKNEEKKPVGSGEFIISLPDNYQDKILEIQLDITEDNAFPRLESIYVIAESKYATSVLTSNYIELITGAMIIVLGIIAIIVSIVLFNFNNYIRRILWTGTLNLLAGCWILARYNILNIFIHSKSIISFIEYGSLYLCVPSIGLMFYELQKNNKAKKISMVLIIISGIMSVLSIIFEFFGIFHMVCILTYMQALGIGIIIYSMIIMFKEFNFMSKSEKLLIHGCIVLILAIIFELLRFNIEKYVFGQNDGRSYFAIGLLLFIILLISSYFTYSKEYINMSVEKRALVDMAYRDILTGLANRAAVMDNIEKMENSKTTNFAIFNFDLNNLKTVNDSLGHLAGDKYLCIFADILKENLSEFDVIGRVGGDEFVAIICKEINKEEAMRKINKMEKIIEIRTEKELNMKMSFACGYAISNKKHIIGVLEAYDNADREMYQCKKLQKKDR